MALSPDEIEGREFGLSRRGYDRDEVDDFLLEVADSVRQHDTEANARVEAAQVAADHPDVGAADEGAESGHPLRNRLSVGPSDTDDFGRLGAEVAAVLRTADEGAARRRAEAEADAQTIRADADAEATRLRDEAEGYAVRLREETDTEAARIRSEAEVEARNARTALAEATEQARVTIQQAQDEAQRLTEESEVAAGARREELLASAERQAGQAASIERDVHGRLLSVRDDLDTAVARLDPEATAAAATSANEQASALDPADTPIEPDDDEPVLGQGPPSPAVPPPPAAEHEDEDDALPYAADDDDIADGNAGDDLPYADADEPLDESTDEENASEDDGPDIDLTDGPTPAATPDLPYADDDDDDDIPPPPPPPPPPPGYESSTGVGPDDLPYSADDGDEASDDQGQGDDEVIDLRDEDGEGGDSEDDQSGDPLAAMVRDAVGKAVQGAMRRRPGGDA